MNPEPLTKEKEKTVSEVEFYNNKELLDVKIKSDGNAKEVFTAFEKSDVKSAVEWLLKEIEKLDRLELEEFSDEKFDNLHDPEEVIAHAVDYFKHLVRKAFSGVLRE